MLYRTEGIVIRSIDYGEGNKIVTIMTPSLGKQGIVIRGARKPKSRYASLAQLFTLGDFSFYKGGGLGSLNNGEIIESYRGLREGLDQAAYASYLVELCDRAIQDEDAGAFLYHQLHAGLTAISEGKEPRIVARLFEMKIAAAAGYAPMLDACANCGREEGPFYFSAAGGGALCTSCRHRDPRAMELEEGVWKLLRVFSAMDMRRLGNVAVKESTAKQLATVMRRWFDHHLALNLKSRHFLDQWERGEDFFKPVP